MTTTDEALELLDDYMSGVLTEADAFEDELFERAARGEASEALFIDRVALLGRFLAGRGGIAMGSTRAQVEALGARGLRIHTIELAAGERAELGPFPDDVDLVVTRIAVDARGFEHLEVECRTLAGQLVKTFRDVQCDPEEGALYAVCEAPLARLSLLVGPVVATMTGVRGGERVVLGSVETHPIR